MPRRREVWTQTIALLVLCASPAAGQATQPPPAAEAALLVGRLSVFPSLTLRDVGVDNNVFNENLNPKQDFTLTAEPGVRASMPVGGMQLTGAATLGLVYYATYKSQQSVNGRFDGRFERTAARLRPFMAGTFSNTRERTVEIDARVLRRDTGLSGGAEVKVTGITSLIGSYSHTSHGYGDDEQFLGTVLSTQLDHISDVASAGAKFAFTPLTTVSVDVQLQRDRFESSAIRDTDSLRVMPAVEFAPDAVITGRAAAGFRRFDPRDSRVNQFSGFVGSANVGYSLLDVTRFSVDAVRDVMYSFDPATPYFLQTSARLTVSQRVGGPVDVIVTAGRDQLRYQGLESLALPERVERTRTVGGGLGFRLGRLLRLALVYDVTERVSNLLDQRAYERRRLLGSMTYGRH